MLIAHPGAFLSAKNSEKYIQQQRLHESNATIFLFIPFVLEINKHYILISCSGTELVAATNMPYLSKTFNSIQQ